MAHIRHRWGQVPNKICGQSVGLRMYLVLYRLFHRANLRVFRTWTKKRNTFLNFCFNSTIRVTVPTTIPRRAGKRFSTNLFYDSEKVHEFCFRARTAKLHKQRIRAYICEDADFPYIHTVVVNVSNGPARTGSSRVKAAVGIVVRKRPINRYRTKTTFGLRLRR